MAALLDSKGFRIRPTTADEHREVTIRAPLDALRVLAFLADSYYDANPAVDNDEVAAPASGFTEAKNQILNQLRAQGVEPAVWSIDGINESSPNRG